MGRKKEYKEWYSDAILRHRKGESQSDIAKHFNVSRERIRQILVEYASHVSKSFTGYKKKVFSLYDNGKSVEEIAARLGRRLGTVRAVLRRADRTVPHIRTKKWYAEAMSLAEDGKSISEISERLGIQNGTVSHFLKKNLTKEKLEVVLESGKKRRATSLGWKDKP